MSLSFTGTGSPVTFTIKYEILFPISTNRETIDLAHRTDSNQWHQGKKINQAIASDLIIEIKLGLRIHRSLYGAFETFLEANYNTQITITATGYDLFDDGNRGLSNNARITGYRGVQRESTNWYRIDLGLVKV